ncbi:MAG: hypothetical protein AAFU66_01130 [Pseudomonadota bacterium]
MKKQLLTIAAIAGLFAAPTGIAETIDAKTAPVLTDANAPTRGMTMDRVESSWGEPQARRAAVGEPPITRWEYAGFTVYFEYDRVIHTVISRG